MHTIVLGAGIIGIASAYYLKKSGHSVTVIDRQPGSALETTFANGGQISVSHAEPWANPSAPLKVLKWLNQPVAPLYFHPHKNDPDQWKWLLRFGYECLPWRTKKNIRSILGISEQSRLLLRNIREEEKIEYNHLEKGIIHFYTSQKEFDGAAKVAEYMRSYGCEREVKDKEELFWLDPSLKSVPNLVGGTYTFDDESGDAHVFTTKLAETCKQMGVSFIYGRTVEELDIIGDKIKFVKVKRTSGAQEKYTADNFVLSMGSYSSQFLKPYGIKLPIYPAKGYSATVPILDSELAPYTSMTDDEYKLVYSRLGDNLRVAGTAELNGYDTQLNLQRCLALITRAAECFPNSCDWQKSLYWTGLRPATPSNVPIIGKTKKYKNLWTNTGHGTLGWTMGCASGKYVSDLINYGMGDLDYILG